MLYSTDIDDQYHRLEDSGEMEGGSENSLQKGGQETSTLNYDI